MTDETIRRQDVPTVEGGHDVNGTLVGLGETAEPRIRARIRIRKPGVTLTPGGLDNPPVTNAEPTKVATAPPAADATEQLDEPPRISKVESDPHFQAVAAMVQDTEQKEDVPDNTTAAKPTNVPNEARKDATTVSTDQLQALPDAGPNGPKQYTDPSAKPLQPPAKTVIDDPKVKRRTLNNVGAVLIAVFCVLVVGLWSYSNSETSDANAPAIASTKVYNKKNCPNAARVTSQTLSVYTDGAQSDITSYVPVTKDRAVLACSAPPPTGTKKGTFNVSACVVCPK